MKIVNSVLTPFLKFRALPIDSASPRTGSHILLWLGSVCLLTLVIAVDQPVHTAAGDLFPADMVRFEPASENPIFTAAGGDHWDARIRERGWIMREKNVWKMWYTGYDGTREGKKKLGYATSKDGVQWTRHKNNPIYDDVWVEDMMIVKHKDVYYMFAEGAGDRAQLLTSKDGVAWTRVGPLDVRKKSGEPISKGPYGTPTAYFEGDTWYLYYERGDRGIWLATSKSMRDWTNVQDEPVLSPGPKPYDEHLVALNQIVKRGGRYFAYYHGGSRNRSPVLWTTNVAVSEDLIHWQKYAGNPLFPVEENKSSGILVHDGKENRLYTMHNEVHLHLPVE